MTDTLFADVSYFQVPVDDSYPYPILSIRSNDGTFRDPNFAQNHAWLRRSLDSGRLRVGIIYCYARPNWLETANTMRDMIDRTGGLHPRTVLMLDVESGGNPAGDGSDWINRTYWNLVDHTGGNPRRVIGYANASDFRAMWPTRPPGLRVIGAGYGRNPNLPGQIAHQYTDGGGHGGGLPEGAPPFGNCDMNAADGLSADQFAAECGIGPSVVNEIDAAARVAAGWLGRRITVGERPTPDGRGRFAEFEHGHIYWSPTMPRSSDGRVHAIPIPHGGLFESWGRDFGYERGPLGYPARPHLVLPAGGVQAFAGGVLFRANGSAHGHFVHGRIGDHYAAAGWERSALGYPTSDEYAWGGGRRQDFEHGSLLWSVEDGVTQIDPPTTR